MTMSKRASAKKASSTTTTKSASAGTRRRAAPKSAAHVAKVSLTSVCTRALAAHAIDTTWAEFVAEQLDGQLARVTTTAALAALVRDTLVDATTALDDVGAGAGDAGANADADADADAGDPPTGATVDAALTSLAVALVDAKLIVLVEPTTADDDDDDDDVASATTADDDADGGGGYEDGRSMGDGSCAMCERDMPLTFHHTRPKETHDHYVRRHGMSRRTLLTTGIMICRPCHSAVHGMWDNKTLARDYNTLDALMASEKVQRWVRFAARQRCTSRSDRRTLGSNGPRDLPPMLDDDDE